MQRNHIIQAIGGKPQLQIFEQRYKLTNTACLLQSLQTIPQLHLLVNARKLLTQLVK